MIETHDTSKCSVCVKAKFTKKKKPFKSITTRCTKLLDLIDTNLADFKNITHRGGKNYITFIDDFSRYTKIYLLKTRIRLVACF